MDNKIQEQQIQNRDKIIVRTSMVGIIANIFLAGFKAVVGIITNSIAVTLDAVNNLSDALSSVITIVGTKLAGKKPDKKHPLGYGRIEYLSAMVVAVIVLYAGVTSMVESVKKIIHPEKASYTTVSLIIIAVAIAVKIVLGRYVKSQGDKVKSGALSASGADAMFDAVLSASVLASAIIFKVSGISLEAFVGAIISGFIIKSGLEMLKETVGDILGKRADAALVKELKHIIASEEHVRGAYDVVISNYGPNQNYASVHVELPDTMTVDQVDVLTRKIMADVFKKTGVILTGVGVYSYNTKDDEAARIRNKIMEEVMKNDFALQMHGFYADVEAKVVRFDVVLRFGVKAEDAIKKMTQQLKQFYPEYDIIIAPDIDVSD
ncbi:MAG: cation diffusion facilitator family transporter [Lachnospiraceae bacterium]|nr:cation diffusion facilitator family transporter [Lachnospiraceae bacterium]